MLDSETLNRFAITVFETAVFAAGAGIQLLCCMFLKGSVGKLVPSVIAKLLMKLCGAVGVSLMAVGFTEDGWGVLGYFLLGLLSLVMMLVPLAFLCGTAVGWFVYALIRTPKNNNGQRS